MRRKKRPYKRRQIAGVALIISNPDGEILILRELQDKPVFGKKKGMLSIPMETCENGELERETIKRLIETELPGFEKKAQICSQRMGVYPVCQGVWAALYEGTMPDYSLPKNVENGEVGHYQWVNPLDALDLWLRPGAAGMILAFIASRL